MQAKEQVAALPYERRDDRLYVLMVTSRDTGRWVIPKGWPMEDRKPHCAAAIEAFEEAGVIGKTAETPVGAYHYAKRLKDGSTVPCRVMVFPLAVKWLKAEWPEAAERERRWFLPNEAAELVHESDLSALLRTFTV